VPSQPSSEVRKAPAEELIDWTAVCRRIVAAQRELFAECAGIAARSHYEGRGAGGDASLVIDLQAEEIVFEELERLAGDGHSLTAVSEERGHVSMGGDDTGHRVVIDPIDGSLNARRTIPSHSLSIAIADGDTMADVTYGFVHDFGSGEEFVAERGAGARLDGHRIRASAGRQGVEGTRDFEIVGLEAADPGAIGPVIEKLAERAYRLRAVGSIAISLCYVGAGRFDGMIACRPCRSVDAAAGQLIAREAGAAVDFPGPGLEGADLGIEARYPVIGAREEAQLGLLRDVQEELA
jgi:myo-inositol-1(or 4)-monophosphatase